MAPYELTYVMEDAVFALIPALASGIPSFAFSIATYVLSALALYTLAKRRGLNKPWLAWIPVVNVWLLGSLSDQYRYVVKGQNKSKRKSLLTLNILMAVVSAVILAVAVGMLVNLAVGAINGMNERKLMETVLGPALGMAGLSLPLAGVSIALVIIRYMALYDVYTSMDPGNNVLFLVLSIVIPVTEPFFLFFNRNKDMGMPPRRQEPVYIPPQPESWENKDYL